MRCSSCLHENRDSALFCSHCGEHLTLACRSCARALRPGARFCDGCGAPAGGGATEGGAERRQVTVMFSDLVGSTPLAERLDPEELRELVHDYHEVCARSIEGQGGHLAQYLGDGVLAYFGYPVAHEQDAAAAVRAGLGIVREIATHGGGRESRLAVRVGIHSGLVVASDMGSRDQHSTLPVGSTVHIASRIQGIAEPDTVVISVATRNLTRGFYEFRDLGTPPLKGISSPMRVFQVLGETGAQSPIEAAMSTGLTPLIGRGVERGLLFERWERTRSGAGQVVCVSGDAGIGKSRLVQELKERLAEEDRPILECRCSPHHESSALFPAIELLRRAWELDGPDEAARFERLEQAVAPYADEVPDILPLMAAFLSVAPPDGRPPLELTPQRQKQRTLEALVAILLGMSQEQPVLLVVEDLHWIDPSSLELLRLLLVAAADARIMVLLTFRPSFLPDWPVGIRPTRVELRRLTSDDSRHLICKVAGGRTLPPQVDREIADRADGVPLYLEELTKTMLESGQLQPRDGRYELIGPHAALEIPATLQESLTARLDRLSPLKEVVQLAATIGRSFSYDLLQSVAGLGDVELREGLDRLVKAELLYVSGAPPNEQYVFKHALIQEAAYEALLRNRRRDYHRKIAETLRSEFPQVVETQPELLAHHWAGAGFDSEAVAFFHRAGRRAIERSADAEAASHLGRALELIPSLAPGVERTRCELELHIDLGVALVATKGFTAPEVEQVYARARNLCDEIGETAHLYNALSGIFLFHQARGELQTALELTRQRLRVAEVLKDEGLIMQVHENLGTLAFWRGEFQDALHSLDEALARYEPERARELALVYGTESGVVCETYAAQALLFQGHPDRALERCRRSVERARALAHANSLGLALAFAAALHHMRREPQQTRSFADEVVAFSEEQQLPFWRGFGMIFQGLARAEQGEVQGGIERMLAGVASFQETGAGLGGPFCLAMLAEAHLRAGRADEGLAMLSGGLRLLGPYEDVFFDGEVARVRGCLLLAASTPDPEAGERCLLDALECARRQGARLTALRAATRLAALWRDGDPAKARQQLEEVYSGFDEGFETADLREAAQLLAELPRTARTSR